MAYDLIVGKMVDADLSIGCGEPHARRATSSGGEMTTNADKIRPREYYELIVDMTQKLKISREEAKKRVEADLVAKGFTPPTMKEKVQFFQRILKDSSVDADLSIGCGEPRALPNPTKTTSSGAAGVTPERAKAAARKLARGIAKGTFGQDVDKGVSGVGIACRGGDCCVVVRLASGPVGLMTAGLPRAVDGVKVVLVRADKKVNASWISSTKRQAPKSSSMGGHALSYDSLGRATIVDVPRTTAGYGELRNMRRSPAGAPPVVPTPWRGAPGYPSQQFSRWRGMPGTFVRRPAYAPPGAALAAPTSAPTLAAPAALAISTPVAPAAPSPVDAPAPPPGWASSWPPPGWTYGQPLPGYDQRAQGYTLQASYGQPPPPPPPPSYQYAAPQDYYPDQPDQGPQPTIDVYAGDDWGASCGLTYDSLGRASIVDVPRTSAGHHGGRGGRGGRGRGWGRGGGGWGWGPAYYEDDVYDAPWRRRPIFIDPSQLPPGVQAVSGMRGSAEAQKRRSRMGAGLFDTLAPNAMANLQKAGLPPEQVAAMQLKAGIPGIAVANMLYANGWDKARVQKFLKDNGDDTVLEGEAASSASSPKATVLRMQAELRGIGLPVKRTGKLDVDTVHALNSVFEGSDDAPPALRAGNLTPKQVAANLPLVAKTLARAVGTAKSFAELEEG